jgi:putative DNA primase/helicase
MNDPANLLTADALEIARLATLPMLQYGRERKEAAERMGVGVGVLDTEVTRARASARFNAPDADRPPEFSDDALALRFTELHRFRLRYVATWGRWLVREPAVWRLDDTVHAFELARAVCRQAAAECSDPKLALAIASSKTVAAVERLAKGDRRHAATVDQWDADPWLLNTPAGVVDLRTGTMRRHDPADLLTKITAVAPGGECPLWIEFLTRITGSRAELHDFLQRAAGYALTGITREHALFLAYGTGANGKGTFLNTLTGILGSYAAVAMMETFTATPGDRHPTDLAMLRGARLVTAQETEEGRRWAESRIKALTGGDPITARFMRQDFFTYLPQFKLFIAGNHKPGLRNVDEAIRRRLHLIPFDVKIPADERDPRLAEKLAAEWPGILQWAIEGCLHWQRNGLAPPHAVTLATDDYLEAEDAIGQWLAECCDRQPFLWCSSAALFKSWRAWCDLAGEYVMPKRRFTQALEARGFAAKRQPGTGARGLTGLAAVRTPSPMPGAIEVQDVDPGEPPEDRWQ